MKLGIFGDSFADIALDDKIKWHENFSWPILLSKKLNIKADYHGRAGTSSWYSYEKFIDTYKQYSHVVFTYSYHWRWPYLDPSLGNHHWLHDENTIKNIHHLSEHDKKTMTDVAKSYNYVFNMQLFKFINQNIVRDVNKICKENNIKLVNLFVDKSDDEPYYKKEDLSFAVLDNLYQVSKKEMIKINGKDYTMHQVCSDLKKMDCRYCHMFEHNNHIVADTIFNLFDSDQIIDVESIQGWVYRDQNADLHYNV